MTTLYPDVSTSNVIARAKSHFTPNYRQAPIVLVRGEGVWVWDRDGRRYLDLIAGIAVCSLGHAHPRLTRAIRDQAEALVHVSNLFYNEPAIALMDRLTELSFADRVFLANSGAEANEAALKLARRYWSITRDQPDKTDFLAFHKSFHGRTFATITATGQPKYHKGFYPLLPGFHYADFGDLASVEAALDAADGRIGAVIIEPVQCEGGLVIPPDGFLKGLEALCRAREVLLIFDEVQTGIGRTAEWFCYEIDGVRPDIMTLAKGIAGGVPLGAMVCNDEVAKGFVPGAHATTFGGNPLACRAALEVVRTIEEDKLLDHVYETGEYLHKKLLKLVKKHDCCLEARGYGLLRGLELVDDPEFCKRLVAEARDRGVLLNLIAGHVLRFAPPLIIERGHIDTAIKIIDEVLTSL